MKQKSESCGFMGFLILIIMNILRTDGGGATTENKRLEILRDFLIYHEIFHVNLLHDHKGLLVVVWEKKPSDNDKELISNVWQMFSEFEIEHKLITYINL